MHITTHIAKCEKLVRWKTVCWACVSESVLTKRTVEHLSLIVLSLLFPGGALFECTLSCSVLPLIRWWKGLTCHNWSCFIQYWPNDSQNRAPLPYTPFYSRILPLVQPFSTLWPSIVDSYSQLSQSTALENILFSIQYIILTGFCSFTCSSH